MVICDESDKTEDDDDLTLLVWKTVQSKNSQTLLHSSGNLSSRT